MVVHHLKAFITSDKAREQQICVKVRLRDLAEEWRKTGGKCIIVVDSHVLAPKLTIGYEFVSGGEYKGVVQRTENFVRAFKEIGVDLVLLFGGGHIAKIDERQRQNAKRIKEQVEKVFSEIEEKPILQQYNSNNKRERPCFFVNVFKDAARSLAEVIEVGENFNRRMVEYIIENKCFGIISDNTDLLVFDGVRHVFSLEDLCLKDMTTIEYRRAALLEILGLPGEAMPIFSTLMGNDIMPYEDMKKYHGWKLRCHSVTNVPEKVGALVRVAKDIFEKSGGEVKEATTLLAEEIFGLKPGCHRFLNIMDYLERSLFTYKIVPAEQPALVQLSDRATWNELKEYARKMRDQFHFGKRTVDIMDVGIYTHRSSLESSKVAEKALSKPECHCVGGEEFCRCVEGGGACRCEDGGEVCASELRCMCGSEALFELRRRIYSVILFEKQVPYGSRQFVEEYFITGCRDYFEAGRPKIYLVSTIPIDVEHPGLYRLWYEDSALDDIRWKLFLWILSSQDCDLTSNDGVSVFRKPFFQDHFGFVGFVLFYLYKVLDVLSRKELEVLLVMTASVPVMNADELKLRTVGFIKKRAVSVSTLYQLTCHVVFWALQLCNLRLQSKTCDLYSGLFFHYLFQQDYPTDILDDLPLQARHNYEEMRSALLDCSVG